MYLALYSPDETYDPLFISNYGFVYVVDEQSVARMRQVTTGDTAGGRWVILAGVSDGERVIVDGLAKVRPDSPVQVEEAKAATPASPAQE